MLEAARLVPCEGWTDLSPRVQVHPVVFKNPFSSWEEAEVKAANGREGALTGKPTS